MRKKNKYKGLFFPSNLKATGHLRLKKNDANVKLVGDLHSLLGKDTYEIHGKLPDGRHISLLECVTIGSIQFHDGEERAVETSVHPHFVIIGSEHTSSGQKGITKLTYQCENAHLFFQTAKTFGTFHPEAEELDALLDAEHERLKRLVDDRDWEPSRRVEELGEYPLVAYFDGNHEMATAEFSSGKLLVWNEVTNYGATTEGVRIKNSVFHTIEFHEPQTLNKAVRSLCRIHQLYELLLGSRQKYKKMQLTLENMDDTKSDPLKLYWNRCNRGMEKRHRNVHPADIPILASSERDHFQTVLANWMNSPFSMDAPRLRFFNGFHSNTYSFDRLIGAANMYDLLPADRVPNEERLAPELSSAVASSRSAFKDLPSSAVRDSMLSALGRTGKPSLRTKILHRANIVNKAMANRFRKLDMVCHHAVLCRNHYVHGSASGFDYEENYSCFAFLTDTLEFIFSSSDLIECGWNPREYLARHSSISHFFGQFIVNYELNLKMLEKVIEKPA